MAINEVPAFSKCPDSTMRSQVGKTKTRTGKAEKPCALGDRGVQPMNVGRSTNSYNVSQGQFRNAVKMKQIPTLLVAFQLLEIYKSSLITTENIPNAQ